jgi:hypothetical protein
VSGLQPSLVRNYSKRQTAKKDARLLESLQAAAASSGLTVTPQGLILSPSAATKGRKTAGGANNV